MAETLEVLEILLRGDDAQLRRILDAAQRESKQTGDTIRRNLDFRDIGASLAGLAGGGGILFALKSAADESVRTAAAVRIYENAVDRAGLSQDTMAGLVDRVAARFGLLRSQVQDAAAPLIKIGLDAETVEGALVGLGASGGLVGADIARSMVQGAQGIAMGRSELLEYSGVMANASDGQKQLAGELGVSVTALDNQQKALGYARAVITETRSDVDDFVDSYGEYNQAQADATREAAELRDTVGQLAQQGLVPLNQALSGTLAWINDLPEGTLRTATAMVAAGAGATTLAAGVGTLALVLGPLAGPAGLFILAAVAAAGFAVALSETNQPTIDATDYIDGLTKANDDLKTAVENASAAEIEAARQRAQIALTEARQTLAEAQYETGARVLQGQRDAATYGITRETFTARPGGAETYDEFINALPGVAVQRAEVEAFERALESAQTQYQELLKLTPNTNPNSPNNPSSPNDPSAPPSTSTTRTVSDIFADLERAGTVSQQFAEALGTPEAKLEDLQTRAGLIGDALKEAFELGAGQAQIDYLVQRLKDLTAEAEGLERRLNEEPVDLFANPPTASYDPTVQQERDERRVRNAQQEAQDSRILAENLGTLRDKALEAGEQLGTNAQDYLTGIVTGLQALADGVGGATRRTDAILAQLDRDAGYTGTGPDSSGTNAAQDAEGRGRRAFLANYLSNTTYTGVGSDSAGYDLNAASRDLPPLEVDANPFSEAGSEFLSSLQSILASAAQDFGAAIASGDFSDFDSGGFLGGLIGAGSTFGLNMIAPGLGSFLGPILGGFATGLFGGGEDDARSRAAEDAERRGGASSIELTVIFTQNNNFEGSMPEQVRQFERIGREQISDIIRQINPSQFAIKPT